MTTAEIHKLFKAQSDDEYNVDIEQSLHDYTYTVTVYTLAAGKWFYSKMKITELFLSAIKDDQVVKTIVAKLKAEVKFKVEEAKKAAETGQPQFSIESGTTPYQDHSVGYNAIDWSIGGSLLKGQIIAAPTTTTTGGGGKFSSQQFYITANAPLNIAKAKAAALQNLPQSLEELYASADWDNLLRLQALHSSKVEKKAGKDEMSDLIAEANKITLKELAKNIYGDNFGPIIAPLSYKKSE